MRYLVPLALLTLTGCGATDVPLSYTSTHEVTVQPTSVKIMAVTVTDERGQDGHYVGTVRGGFGDPLKTIRTTETTSDAVGNAVRDALKARGLLGDYGDTLRVRITRFDVNQYERREAHADFTVTLTDRSGRPVYHDSVQTQEINGSIMTMDAGLFASPYDLSDLMLTTMNESIDAMLDKPRFRAALAPLNTQPAPP
jgi:hypothetical protein